MSFANSGGGKPASELPEERKGMGMPAGGFRFFVEDCGASGAAGAVGGGTWPPTCGTFGNCVLMSATSS
eukprot:12882026-Prorocentrum_lima.AAC.1